MGAASTMEAMGGAKRSLSAGGLGVGLASAGAAVGQVLGDTSWAWVGGIVGAVSGAFAPTLYDAVRERGRAKETARSVAELTSGDTGPASLLAPHREAVDFVGREVELAALEAWCADPSAARVRLVTGPGGIGKTRLMLRLISRLDERTWGVIRVAAGEEATALERWRDVSQANVLVVVDYAETRQGLEALLRSVVADDGKRVRLLLLARDVGEWWDRLGSAERPVREAHARATVELMVLSPQVKAEMTDAEVVDAAVADFARKLGVTAAPKVVIGDTVGRARILDLHAVALVGLLTARESGGLRTVRVDLGMVLEDLLGHEARFWRGSAEAMGLCDGPAGLTVEMLAQIVAAGALLGARTAAEAVAVVGRVPGVPQSRKIAEWLRGLYPPDGGEGWLGSLRPDRLAELHVTHQLAASDDLARACLTKLDDIQAQQALIVLGRASTDYEAAESLLERILPLVSRVAAALQAPRETLIAISNAIPYPSLALAEADAIIADKVLHTFPPDDRSAERGQWLTIKGALLGQLGRLAEALPPAQEAVTIRRELAEAYPDRYRPDLATSLSNLGSTFSALGRPAEAEAASNEAQALLRGHQTSVNES